MAIWNKKEVSKEVVKSIHQQYGCDLLTASIFARRGITSGEDIFYFQEDDCRFLHNPFLLNAMEDAVDRILAAKEEGEKVLIFGDRDVDGITSTTLLYDYLSSLGIDVSWRLPSGDDAYGLSIKAIEDFNKEYGTLIITVDCGISNNEEIDFANSLGIDVIVVDHHNPPEVLPNATVIVNPKIEDSGYPFVDISGCAVAFKVVSALRFSQTEFYKQEICLLNARPLNDAYVIECIKIANMKEIARLSETIIPGIVSIQNTRLVNFLKGQQILVWDEPLQKRTLETIFGKGIDFYLLDAREEISKLIPFVANLSLLRLKDLSKIAKYQEGPASEMDGFLNIFITYVQKVITTKEKQQQEIFDLQLVMLAALADIMPLKNENRIFLRQGLDSINKGIVRSGLKELLARQNLLGKRIGSSDLSWNIVPLLNATGRLGKPEIAMNLLAEKDGATREKIADEIIELNKERRQLGTEGWNYIVNQAYENFDRLGQKLVLAVDERINRGVTGILASKLVQTFKVPGIVITKLEDGTAIGSMRSTRGFEVLTLLDQCADLFYNYGGHNFAAGFSLPNEKLPLFIKKIEELSQYIEFSEKAEGEEFTVDAELPFDYLTPDLLKLVDKFEPYGEENDSLLFLAKNVKICDASTMGKTERTHLKMTLDCGKNKWVALFWGAGEKLNRDFAVGDRLNILFQVSRNTFNGNESAQMILVDVEKV
ncbi:MAG: single-stranded-DNA-specific exonuclease RecJ [Spirochaetaceae bacterium]|nr:single-stranded-DNA-specific exonuclease RecJ [Spirochaetaceae bacterium]